MEADREEFSRMLRAMEFHAANLMEASDMARKYVIEYEERAEHTRVKKRSSCAAWKKRRYAADPEFRARCCAKAAERYQRRKAEMPQRPPAADKPAPAPRGRPQKDGLPSGSEAAREADLQKKKIPN